VRPAPISSAIRGLFFIDFEQAALRRQRMEIADAGARLMIAGSAGAPARWRICGKFAFRGKYNEASDLLASPSGRDYA
jgi:hypothetical protein